MKKFSVQHGTFKYDAAFGARGYGQARGCQSWDTFLNRKRRECCSLLNTRVEQQVAKPSCKDIQAKLTLLAVARMPSVVPSLAARAPAPTTMLS